MNGRWVTFEGGPLDKQTLLILHGDRVVTGDGSEYRIEHDQRDPLIGGWFGVLQNSIHAPSASRTEKTK